MEWTQQKKEKNRRTLSDPLKIFESRTRRRRYRKISSMSKREREKGEKNIFRGFSDGNPQLVDYNDIFSGVFSSMFRAREKEKVQADIFFQIQFQRVELLSLSRTMISQLFVGFLIKFEDDVARRENVEDSSWLGKDFKSRSEVWTGSTKTKKQNKIWTFFRFPSCCAVLVCPSAEWELRVARNFPFPTSHSLRSPYTFHFSSGVLLTQQERKVGDRSHTVNARIPKQVKNAIFTEPKDLCLRLIATKNN